VIIVCNTSPISNLAVIGRLDLLRSLYGEISIPQAVASEVAKIADSYPQAAAVPNLDWITTSNVSDRVLVQNFRNDLDLGESEAIALGLELNCDLLLIDEQLGRNVAIAKGLKISGLLGVLIRAKMKGLIPFVKPIVNELISKAGFRVSKSLYNHILELAGEKAVS
jgi:uncharacterized protein